MRLIERHLFGRICILTIGFAFALVHAIVVVALEMILVPIVKGAVPWSTLVDAYLGAMPNAVYLTLPLATALAIVLAYYRWWVNGTIAVLYASRLSTWRLASPALAGGVVAAAIGAVFANYLAPLGASILEDAKHRIRYQIEAGGLEEGRFNVIESPNAVLFVRYWVERNHAEGVFLFQRLSKAEQRSVMARQAFFVRQPGALNIVFLDGTLQTYAENAKAPKSVRFERLVSEIPTAAAPPRAGRPPYEYTTAALLHLPERVKSDERFVRHARSELHKRIAVPALSLVFAALGVGLCLARNGARGAWPRFLAIGGAAIALHIGLVILVDTGTRYSPWVVPLAYAVVAATALAAFRLLQAVAGRPVRVLPWPPGRASPAPATFA